MAELHSNQMYFLVKDYDKERKYINWQRRFDDVSDLAYYGNQNEVQNAYAKYSLTASGVLSGSDDEKRAGKEDAALLFDMYNFATFRGIVDERGNGRKDCS